MLNSESEIATAEHNRQCRAMIFQMETTIEQAMIESLMRDVDRTLLRENLKLTPAQRLEKFVNAARFASELQRAGDRMRRRAVQTAKL